jgi:hypothetical protein
MKFTFGIITFPHPDNLFRINTIIDSIERLNIPEDSYEVIIVGGNNPCRKNTSHIPFNESIKPNWITRKKNIITWLARYENVVYSHDYLTYDPDWYEGFLKFGNNFNVCSNRIYCVTGERFRDWIVSPARSEKLNTYLTNKLITPAYLIPHDITHLNHFVVIGGYYWVGKKQIMHEFPLEEALSWGDGEDFRWCHALQKKYNVSFNRHSTNRLLKEKGRYFTEMSDATGEELRRLVIPDSELVHDYQHYDQRKIESLERGQGVI